MAWSLSGFTFRFQVAFDAGPRNGAPTWVDVTTDVRAAEGFTSRRGRTDGYSRVASGTADVSMRNGTEGGAVAGRWTPGVAAGPWHPLKLRRQARLQVQWSSVWYDLWAGHVSDFAPKWVGAASPVCDLSLSDLLANLAITRLPSLVVGEMLSDAPALMYPLDDDAASSTAGDRSGIDGIPTLGIVQVGSNGTLAFGAGLAPGPDGGTVAAFTTGTGSYDASNGKMLKTASSVSTIINSGFGGDVLAAMLRPSGSRAMTALSAEGALSITIRVGTSASGKAVGTIVSPLDAVNVTLTGSTTLPLTSATAVALRQSVSAGTVTCDLLVNGAVEATTTYARAFVLSACPDLYVGGQAGGALWDGQISHVAWYNTAVSTARLLEQSNARTGFLAERTDQRFARLCRIAGLPSTLYTAGTGLSTMCAQPVAGQSLPEALAKVQDAEAGVVGIDAAGKLRLYPRDARYNAAVALTLDARTEILNDLSGFVVNDEGLLNDLTIRRPGGATQRYVNAASVTDNGTQSDTLDLLLADDLQALALGQWLANQRATPQPKAPTLKISAARLAAVSPAKVPALLGLDIGSRVTVTNLPAGAPAASLDLFVEGVALALSTGDLVLTLNTSAAGTSGTVWQLDSATYSVLDSTTVLAA